MIALLSAFARYIREGHAGRGHQVRSGSVQDALCAIGKILELDGRPNPIYQIGAYQRYWEPIHAQINSYKRDDPRSQPQLAVPVTITEHILAQHWQLTQQVGHCPNREAKADLTNIAFYYLLRGGEYTKPRNHKTQTVPFAPKDVTFRNSRGRRIPNTPPLALLNTATEATIWMPNQKNGVKGQCITQQCTGTLYSPIKSLARRVHHIMSHTANESVPIYNYCKPGYRTWSHITANNINTTLKQAAGDIGLYSQFGYDPSDISSHSLRAGGAMAMHLNGVDATTIQKMGRWKSRTFLMYIHEQISAFATGVSLKMSRHIPFRCIAGPTTTHHPPQHHTFTHTPLLHVRT